MHDISRACVQPIAESGEGWALTLLETDDLDIEGAQCLEQRAMRAEVVVAEAEDAHLTPFAFQPAPSTAAIATAVGSTFPLFNPATQMRPERTM